MPSREITPNEITALLGRGTTFEGRLLFEGTVRIDGNFQGEIVTRDTLILGDESRVKATIHADVVIVGGYLEGRIHATNRVEIQANGYIKGSVEAPIFRIDEGGLFDGTTQMVAGTPDAGV